MLWGAAVFAVRIVNEYYPPWLRWKTNLCLIRTPASCSDCCVSPSGFFSFSGLCWAQTLIYQMSCCMVVLDTFMLCCTLTKRSALTLWMRTPLQRWDLHMSYVLFQINNDKDVWQCYVTLFVNILHVLRGYSARVWCCKQHCTEVFGPELARCHQYLIQLFERG